jgi:glc operon protein GlcG
MAKLTRENPRLTLEGAKAVLASAERRAAEIGVPMDIAVVDDGGHMLAFSRMDGAKISSVEIAMVKAHSAAIRRQPSGPYLENGQPNLVVTLGLMVGSRARQTPLRGGLPLLAAGHCVGAIGVSNGSEEQDLDVARAGAAALESD